MAIFAYPENITGFVEFVQYTNTLVNGMLGMGILIIVFMVSFLSAKSYSYERAFGFSSFLTMISAILLRFMNLITDWMLSIAIIMTGGAIILLMRERSVENV